jgi:hypothetical protein
LHDLLAIVGIELDDRAVVARSADEVGDHRCSRAHLGKRAALGSGPLVHWLGVCLGLQAVQIIGGALRVRGRGEDEALIVAQCLEPVADIGRVIVAHFGGDFEVGAEEGGAELGTLS